MFCVFLLSFWLTVVRSLDTPFCFMYTAANVTRLEQTDHGLDYLFTGVHINQDLIWCVKNGVCMGFWVHGGS